MTRGWANGPAARCPYAAVLAALAAGLVLAGCSGGNDPVATGSAPSSASASPASPTGSASPESASPATATPATASPGTASPSASPSGSPGTASPAVGPSGGPSPSSSGVQVTCASVTVTGLGRTSVGPLRTTDVATVVSDGRNLTPGTRQQTDFVAPVLTAPGGGTITDPGTVQQVANLLAGQKHRVLVERPAAPDEGTDPTRRPFSSPGTYAVYNASSLLTTEAVVQCAGQQQTWTFTAEGDPATGQINCAVEPARSNALARSIFAQSC